MLHSPLLFNGPLNTGVDNKDDHLLVNSDVVSSHLVITGLVVYDINGHLEVEVEGGDNELGKVLMNVFLSEFGAFCHGSDDFVEGVFVVLLVVLAVASAKDRVGENSPVNANHAFSNAFFCSEDREDGHVEALVLVLGVTGSGDI